MPVTCRNNPRYEAFCRATGRNLDEPGLGWGRVFTAWMESLAAEAGDAEGVSHGRGYPTIVDHSAFTAFVVRRAEEIKQAKLGG